MDNKDGSTIDFRNNLSPIYFVTKNKKRSKKSLDFQKQKKKLRLL